MAHKRKQTKKKKLKLPTTEQIEEYIAEKVPPQYRGFIVAIETKEEKKKLPRFGCTMFDAKKRIAAVGNIDKKGKMRLVRFY